ncbi:MAG TPA: hypothetical protein DCG47_10240, partial [Spirochaetaceae bacterium]|nr:hypothetical protein [Spirochaetaceae bacterium]
MEAPLLALIAAKDKKTAEATLALLQAERRTAMELELALTSSWSAWTGGLSAASIPAHGSPYPLAAYDRYAHTAELSKLRMAENAALAEARRFIAKAALAKNFNAVALRLLSDFERGLDFPPSLLAGGTALATLKIDQLR